MKIEQQHLSHSDLMAMEQRYRASLVNSLSGFKSVALIGTHSLSSKQTNLAIFNSLVHIGANPPYIGFISRPDQVERHTLQNILDTGYYTINHINESIYKQAHQTSARYTKDQSEFDATGLTPVYKENFEAPYVNESFIQLGVEFKEMVPLSINNTSLVIGRIVHVYFPSDCLKADGFIDPEQAQSITCSGLDSYHLTQRLARLSYAKPGTVATKIDENQNR
jgi:flavin reductase (DIM6/NTAB) family NADH-FMN oxidoreductase RutF